MKTASQRPAEACARFETRMLFVWIMVSVAMSSLTVWFAVTYWNDENTVIAVIEAGLCALLAVLAGRIAWRTWRILRLLEKLGQ